MSHGEKRSWGGSKDGILNRLGPEESSSSAGQRDIVLQWGLCPCICRERVSERLRYMGPYPSYIQARWFSHCIGIADRSAKVRAESRSSCSRSRGAKPVWEAWLSRGSKYPTSMFSVSEPRPVRRRCWPLLTFITLAWEISEICPWKHLKWAHSSKFDSSPAGVWAWWSCLGITPLFPHLRSEQTN